MTQQQEQPVLFDDDPTARPGLKLAVRQMATMLRGVHPISEYPLHPTSAPPADHSAPGLRCRDCYFAVRAGVGYFKCGVDQGKHVGHGVSTDLMLWFPACTKHTLDTPLTDDRT